jgi:hypothetical protein
MNVREFVLDDSRGLLLKADVCRASIDGFVEVVARDRSIHVE